MALRKICTVYCTACYQGRDDEESLKVLESSRYVIHSAKGT
jgi:hypothetical protein